MSPTSGSPRQNGRPQHDPVQSRATREHRLSNADVRADTGRETGIQEAGSRDQVHLL